MKLPWTDKNSSYVKQLLYLLGEHRRLILTRCEEVGSVLFNLTMDDTYYEHWAIWCNGTGPNQNTLQTWRSFQSDTTVDLNTLCNWVNHDNPVGFFNLQFETAKSLIMEILVPFCSHQTNYLDESKLAHLIHQLFHHQISYVPDYDQFYLYLYS